MRTIVVFEGIASTGKTTLEQMLVKHMRNVTIFSEGETLMPIIDNRDKNTALKHLEELFSQIKSSSGSEIIIDRFHLTHAFRTSSDLGDFSDLENELKNEGDVLVVLLTIDPTHIKERIEETLAQRKDGWKKGAQGSIDEKVAYYTKQQEILKTLLSKSRLPSLMIDTTEKAWEKYVGLIIEELKKVSGK